MYEKLIKEINKLPNVLTRQQLINWYIDNRIHNGSVEITTGKLIELCKKCGKKIEGQSKLAIHITEKQEKEFAKRVLGAPTGQKMKAEYKEDVKKLYWDQGKSIRELAEKYNCSKYTVERFMESVGIPKRSRGFGA